MAAGGGGPDSPGSWQSFPRACGHAKASLLLQKHSSGSKESCVSSQGKASGQTGIMAHKKLFANQKTLTQTHHSHSTSWTKARALHFKEDLAKESQILNNCIPTVQVEKHTKAHRELDGVQHLPFSAIKAWGRAKHCSSFCWGRQSIPSASEPCNSSVHLHPR